MEKKKKVWIKPEITRVELLPEEAVLAACKSTGGVSGPAAGNCSRPAPGCRNIGS